MIAVNAGPGRQLAGRVRILTRFTLFGKTAWFRRAGTKNRPASLKLTCRAADIFK